MPDFTNLQSVLAFLAGTLGAAWWMLTVSKVFSALRNPDPYTEYFFLIAWLSEQINKLTDIGAYVVVFLVSVGVPALAAWLLGFLPDTFYASVQPYYGTAIGLLVLFFAQQGIYSATKRR